MTAPGLGEPAPRFTAATPSNPEFVFDTVGGRYVLMGFLPVEPRARAAALAAVAARRALFDDMRACAFLVSGPEAPEAAPDAQGLRWILDRDRHVARHYGALADDGTERPGWVLLDPTLRLLANAPASGAEAMLGRLAVLPPPHQHAGAPVSPPILIVPRVFDARLCDRLVALHETTGGEFTGVMRDIDGRTRAVMDDGKKRRDVLVADESLRAEITSAFRARLFPMIERAFQFHVTHIERHLVACYDAQEGGAFAAHRDDTTRGTAHRRFACTINLNDGYHGGDLTFPEFGLSTWRAPIGGAVVFSCSLLHEVTPLVLGRRYAFLPFFFDEAGAETLRAYQAALVQS